ncbi:methyl-accepting chemotaxis protein [Thiomicrorhabdus sp. zzn3]|uniref:HAMP domain-containing methyl-accepting chemotaxis protein n=1 Tax=Thiomicrorhabdus sp. zzn3 TaxID=3039775 RepID=UPI00243649BD|nr:methyl-accepting chemotaxis protein [Thiomicrorhabdus sp. zzn3]MDG6777806.1 methyl-accepting chemotaxis protein [Thiomicrorhabdus sp. zzn3]
MTVKLRLILAFSVLILMTVILGVVSLMKIDSINNSLDLVVDDRVPKVVTLLGIDQRRVSVERDIGQLIQAREQVERDEALRRIGDRRALNEEAYQYLDESIQSKEGRALLAKTSEARKAQSENLNRMIELAKSGKTQEALDIYLSKETRDLSRAYRNAVREFVDFQKELSKQASDEGSAAGEFAMKITLVILVISLIVGGGFFAWIMRVVVRPVVAMQEAMQEVVKTGQFDKQVEVLNRDEIGLSVEALNALLKSMEYAIADANNTIGALAQGDFSQRITRNYVGDLDKLKLGINNSADNVTNIMNELGRVMKSLYEGEFDVDVNTDAQGEYRSMLVNTSEAMNDINNVISNINSVMEALQDGRFQERVNVEARGELNLMKQRINSSMQDLDSAMTEIIRVVVAQSEGDLTNTINAQYRGDLETLKLAVNTSAQKLIEVVSKAVTASNIVNGAAEEVSRGSSDLSQRVQEQAAALEETSATMNEMSSAVEANTKNAQEAAGVANGVQAQANEGSEVMSKTIEAMNAIQESSHKIADIVTLIDGIAFQTNLLALNAAVEAARAGDHGRGFAVVAGEVRALAQKSAEAAKDIKNLIDESVTRISQGTELASQSGEMLNTINESIDSVTQMVQQIAEASSEQANGVAQVHVAITQIDQVTQQNAALVEETTAAAESMSEQSNALRDDMAFFKTGAPAVPARVEARKIAPQIVNKPVDGNSPKMNSSIESKPVHKGDDSDEWSSF